MNLEHRVWKVVAQIEGITRDEVNIPFFNLYLYRFVRLPCKMEKFKVIYQ